MQFQDLIWGWKFKKIGYNNIVTDGADVQDLH